MIKYILSGLRIITALSIIFILSGCDVYATGPYPYNPHYCRYHRCHRPGPYWRHDRHWHHYHPGRYYRA